MNISLCPLLISETGKAIKGRIEAKRIAKERQQQAEAEEDNKKLVTEYEEVQAGNTILPKAVSVKINGFSKATVANGQAPPDSAKESRHVAVQATVHHENEQSNIENMASTDQVTLQERGNYIPNGQIKSAATTCTQTNATSKESLVNNINKQNMNTYNSHAEVILHNVDNNSDTISRRKTFAQSNSVPEHAPGESVGSPGQEITDKQTREPPQGTGLLQLPPDANGSVPHGLPEMSSAEIENVTGDGLSVAGVAASPCDEDSWMDTTMDSTPKNSEPDIYTTAYESPVKVKPQQLSQGYENAAYLKNLESPD